mgnify:CR=1 FL=1
MKLDKDKLSGWAVHAFTGSGAVLGFLAMVSILNNDQVGAFLFLGIAIAVDGIDGNIARKIGVEEKVPNLDGTTLDNIIDYFNYVINPALMIYYFNMVPSGFEIILPAIIIAVSLYTFINVNMKTDDYYFTGFPSLWNIVVLYFFILNTNVWINFVVIIILSVLTFVPWKYVHPFRVKSYRNLTIFFTIVWSATTLRLVTKSEINLIINDSIVLLLWLICTGYFTWICFIRSIKDYS